MSALPVLRPRAPAPGACVVLGIDPGTITTGWGVIVREGSRLIHVDNGLITGRSGDPLETRLLAIFEGLDQAIREHLPAVIAIEAIFAHRSAKSALTLGHARGVALLAASRHGIPVSSYAPALVKKSVVGHGRAEKAQVQAMVKMLLGLPEVPAEDAADALAIGICHCHHEPQRAALASTLKGSTLEVLRDRTPARRRR